MEKMNTVQPLFPHLPDRIAGLEELAENLWWSWNPGARILFKTLDRQAWKESGHNPDKMLREIHRLGRISHLNGFIPGLTPRIICQNWIKRGINSIKRKKS